MTGNNRFISSVPEPGCHGPDRSATLCHDRLERPQRQRDEHHVEEHQHGQPCARHGHVDVSLEQRRRAAHPRNDYRNRDGIQQHRQQHVPAARAYEHGANNRPTAVNPTVPDTSSPSIRNGVREERRLEHERDQRDDDDFGPPEQQEHADQFAHVEGRPVTGAIMSARNVSLCRSRSKARPAPACPRRRWQSTGCRRRILDRPSLPHEPEGEHQHARYREEHRRVQDIFSRLRTSQQVLPTTSQTVSRKGPMPHVPVAQRRRKRRHAARPGAGPRWSPGSHSCTAHRRRSSNLLGHTWVVTENESPPALRSPLQAGSEARAWRVIEPGERLVEQPQRGSCSRARSRREALAHCRAKSRDRVRRSRLWLSSARSGRPRPGRATSGSGRCGREQQVRGGRQRPGTRRGRAPAGRCASQAGADVARHDRRTARCRTRGSRSVAVIERSVDVAGPVWGEERDDFAGVALERHAVHARDGRTKVGGPRDVSDVKSMRAADAVSRRLLCPLA